MKKYVICAGFFLLTLTTKAQPTYKKDPIEIFNEPRQYVVHSLNPYNDYSPTLRIASTTKSIEVLDGQKTKKMVMYHDLAGRKKNIKSGWIIFEIYEEEYITLTTILKTYN